VRGLASSDATDFWRHRCQPETRDVDRYQASVAAPHRTVLLEALAACQPWRRLHELGCHMGPNLARIRERFPDALVSGCDVDANAIAAGQAWFDDDPNVALWQADLFDDLNVPYFQKPDVLLTCYTLAYVHPDDLSVVLRRLVQEAQRAIVLAEPMAAGASRLTHGAFPEWAHDYAAALATAVADAGRTARACLWHIQPPVDCLNAVLLAVFSEPPPCLP